MNRRFLFAAAVTLLLGACSSSGSDFSDYLKAVREGFHASRSTITLKQAAAIPYASMGWRLKGDRQQIIVLATDTPEGQLWTSATHVVLVTLNGRLVRTLGLPHDLGNLAPNGAPQMPAPALALRGPYSDQRIVDFKDMGVFGADLRCRGRSAGARSVEILGKKIDTIRVDESCSSTQLHWSFVNSFWVDPATGFVWRTLQYTHPKSEPVQTDIFRPPG